MCLIRENCSVVVKFGSQVYMGKKYLCYLNKRVYAIRICGWQTEYLDINKSLFSWYSLVCSKNPIGSQPLEKTKEISVHLGMPDCKVSNSWLRRHIESKGYKLVGNEIVLREILVERLPEIISGYQKYDIWNMAGIFWDLLNGGFEIKEKNVNV